MYFLPVRSRLNCSAACLLYLPGSRPRVHIDVHRALSLSFSLSLAILFRFRCTTAALQVCASVQRAPVIVVVVVVLVVLFVHFVHFVVVVVDVVVVVLLSVIFASRQVVKFDRRRRQLHKWQMQKKVKCVSCIVRTAIAKTKVRPIRLSIPRWSTNVPFVLLPSPS